jgi:hypothetical protein
VARVCNQLASGGQKRRKKSPVLTASILGKRTTTTNRFDVVVHALEQHLREASSICAPDHLMLSSQHPFWPSIAWEVVSSTRALSVLSSWTKQMRSLRRPFSPQHRYYYRHMVTPWHSHTTFRALWTMCQRQPGVCLYRRLSPRTSSSLLGRTGSRSSLLCLMYVIAG